ncbi:hypothetical protein V6U78_07345 [Marinospirillum sp. MEB164]|uniref:Replication initiation factor n=1 Tax=Marinospirillum alkalitolerans TaxID=3123374 RepID=A0ABW8PX22_9GAMM
MLHLWDRTSLDSLFTENPIDGRGAIMLSSRGQVDTSSMKILASTVDTIRQLYVGIINPDRLSALEQAYKGHDNYVADDGTLYAVGGAMQGGYKYRIQSNDIGVIVMIKHRYHDPDAKAPHVKIELSPKLIQSLDPLEIQHYMDDLASYWLDDPQPTGCAVHMATDIQGWQPPHDLLNRFVCRSKRIASNSGISDFSIESGQIATTYNYGQSMLFGTARSMQCAIYNKTAEALHRDKLDFWEAIWKRLGGDDPFTSAYDPEKPVWRVEIRLHQSVIREFASGTLDDTSRFNWLNTRTGELIGTNPELNRFIDIVPHLSGLWRKSMMSFRLDLDKGKLIDPFWQRLLQDPLYFDTEETLDYKRLKKTPGQGSEKNIGLALGNLLSLYARNSFTSAYALHCLAQCGIWHEIQAYYESRGIGLAELKELIKQKLTQRRLLGRV